ncbi:MAG: hypothetical protein ACP5XB_26955 [Isosphaeraceae bacterium]
MPDQPLNKYRAAIEVLMQGRDRLVESLADDVLDQREILLDGGFQFHEFLEAQGARLHFLGLILGHLEQSAELMEEVSAARQRFTNPEPRPEPPQPRKRPRGRNPRNAKPRKEPPPTSEGTVDDIPF